jgi:hypothetical protein
MSIHYMSPKGLVGRVYLYLRRDVRPRRYGGEFSVFLPASILSSSMKSYVSRVLNLLVDAGAIIASTLVRVQVLQGR